MGGTVNRRTFLVASTAAAAGLPWGAAAGGGAPTTPSKGAKTTILFFLCGGASHIDTWDLKPQAPAEYRGPFQPAATSATGVQLCEHLPLLARQAHHLAIVNSLGHYGRGTGDHHAGYYYNLTGHAPDVTFRTQGNNRTPYPDDWPFMGAVVAAKRPAHPYLTNAVTLPHKPSKAPYTRPGQFAAKLGVEHDPLYIKADVDKPLDFRAPSLTLQADVDRPRLQARRELLDAVNQARRDFDQYGSVRRLGRQQQKAYSLLASARTAQAFDVRGESPSLRERYGETVNGMSLLMARRLAEAEVPFVTVFWRENTKLNAKCKSAGGWDTHGNNFGCLKDHLLPEFDQGFSALIEDLNQRGMLDQTLLLVSSEMGRKPKIGDPRSGGKSGAGRDHWTHCMSAVFAGGGIRGGQTYGSSDRLAEYPDDHPVAPEDISKTVFHAMGVHDLTAFDPQNRPYDLMADGAPILSLF